MKKSKLFGMAAMAAMMLGSCSTDEVVNDYSPENAIQFGTYVGRNAESRATVIDDTKLGTDGFGVFAYYTGKETFASSTVYPNFMYNQCVKKDTQKGWVYEPVKYWPNTNTDTESHKISFFAYAPWDANQADDGDPNTTETNYTNLNLISNDATGSPTVSYLVDTDVTKQVDLLYAKVIDATKQAVDGNVKFVFSHALSRIGFKVQALVDKVNSEPTQTTPDTNTDATIDLASGTSVTVDEIKITFGSSYMDNGSLDLGTGNWTKGTQINNTSRSYTLNTNNFETITMTKEPQLLNKSDSYLLILPCQFDALADNNSTDNEDKMDIEVKYTVTTTDANLVGGKSTIVNQVNSGKFTWTFEQGKAYNFVLHLGMTSIKIDAQVTAWDPTDGSDVVVNVPLNTTNP